MEIRGNSELNLIMTGVNKGMWYIKKEIWHKGK